MAFQTGSVNQLQNSALTTTWLRAWYLEFSKGTVKEQLMSGGRASAMPNFRARDFTQRKHYGGGRLRSMQHRLTLIGAFWRQVEIPRRCPFTKASPNSLAT